MIHEYQDRTPARHRQDERTTSAALPGCVRACAAADKLCRMKCPRKGVRASAFAVGIPLQIVLETADVMRPLLVSELISCSREHKNLILSDWECGLQRLKLELESKLPMVLEVVAKCYGVTPAEIAEATTSNARRLFSI